MSKPSLTAEQLRRIEENRQKALALRQQKQSPLESTGKSIVTTSPHTPNSKPSTAATSPYFNTPHDSPYFSPPKPTATNIATNSNKAPSAQKNLLNYFTPKKNDHEQLGTSVKEDKMEEDDEDEMPLAQLNKKRQTEEQSTPKAVKRSKSVTKTEASPVAKAQETPLKKQREKSEAASDFEMYKFNAEKTPQKSTLLKENDTKSYNSNKKETEDSVKKSKQAEWLINIRDANKRLPSDPDYDPTSLYIPENFFTDKTTSEAQKQFWQIKRHHFNRVVFFQQGTFYNVFDRDADVLHTEFDLLYAGGKEIKMRQTGVNGEVVDRYIEELAKRGYQVAKVSQIKDPSNTTKGEKRKLDFVVTPGTTSDPSILPTQSNYLLTIKEGNNPDTGKIKYAICLVEASLGEYAICEFEDDKYYNTFTALLLRMKPIEIVYENTAIDKNILKLVKRHCPDAILVPANPVSDFWEAGKARKYIEKSNYFGDSLDKYPSVLKDYWENDIVLSCVGATLCYLIKLNILREDGSDLVCQNMSLFDVHGSNSTLILDSVTLRNLEVLENRYRKGEGSLLWLIDHTHTKFGKRLLRKWISFPLRIPSQINERLDAVDELIQLLPISEFNVQVVKVLKSLPDLERDISRLFSGKSNVKLFLSILNGFQIIQGIFDSWGPKFEELQIKSNKLRSLFQLGKDNSLNKILKYFSSAIRIEGGNEDKQLNLNEGYFKEYDQAQEAYAGACEELAAYESSLKETIPNLTIKEVSGDFTIEVSSKYSGKVPKDFEMTKELKSCTRYNTKKLTKLVKTVEVAKEELQTVSKNSLHFLVEKFNSNFIMFKNIVQCVAELDCLLSLAITSSKSTGGIMVRPIIKSSSTSSIKVKDMYHPSLAIKIQDFIRNDVELGMDKPPVIVLTGPNMGGKSTILRQVCITIILAQIGCFVPAESCVIAPFDRIFTRIGANDNIMFNESTFMVELHETAQILKYATQNSLIILDELGRGTSTFDGYSIAYAVLDKIANSIKSCTLFATHYHMLTQEFAEHEMISLKRMKLGEVEDEFVPLYCMEDGACLNSYGLAVAKFAGVPLEVVERATVVAKQFQSGSHDMLAKKGSPVVVDMLQAIRNKDADSILRIWETLRNT